MPDPADLPAVDRITVYGADWCPDCVRTKRFLDGRGTAYAWVDTSTDKIAKAMLHDAGYVAIPVVQIPGGAVLMEPSNDALAAALGDRS
jgi:glutaredoxin